MDVRYDQVNEEVKVMELRKSQTREKIEVNTEMPRGQNKADFRRNKTSLLLQISMFFLYIFYLMQYVFSFCVYICQTCSNCLANFYFFLPLPCSLLFQCLWDIHFVRKSLIHFQSFNVGYFCSNLLIQSLSCETLFQKLSTNRRTHRIIVMWFIDSHRIQLSTLTIY